jgi:hypothetical protein
MNSSPSVAVVIPLRNESVGLRILLEELLRQLPPDGEIVAVNAGSTDETGSILSSMAAADGRLRRVSAPNALPGAARNAGVAATKAPFIIQIDGGCMIEPGWVEALYSPLREGIADYVTGSVKAMDAKVTLFGISFNTAPLIFSFMPGSSRSADFIAGGAAVAYLRTVWERCNGQPDWLRVGEDVLFAAKAKRIGIRHHFAAFPHCRWQVGPGMREALIRRIRYVRGDLLLSKPGPLTTVVFRRTAVLIAALLAGAMWSQALPVTLVIILLIWARFCFKTIRRYSTSSKEAVMPLPIVAVIFAAGSFFWLAAEAIGLINGLYLRISNPSYRKRAQAYLKSMTVTLS